jgi:ferredoxin
MATMIIGDECISCGACVPECPNEAIREGADAFEIDPQLCSECVGFHDVEACQAVCPDECCVPDPSRVEDEATLLERAQRLHPERTFPSPLPAGLTRFANPNRQR